ncbi:AAWKG family protein [Streptomyces erythrochromogenes]|uniref:AAWKG family protein n=1 Tax=Streptomyces erythrochromogenes TaxID=285574 RepID=UPI00381600DE
MATPSPPQIQTRWEYVVGQLTSFAGGKREDVGKVGSTGDQTVPGTGWLRAKTDALYLTSVGDAYDNLPNVDTKGPERIIKFYDIDHDGTGVQKYWKITLSVPWNEGGNDFSNKGKAGAFDWGYGEALESFVKKGTTANLDLGYSGVAAVDPKDSIQLATILAAARSFDEVRTFFIDYQKKIEAWSKSLGGDDAAWKGSAADVFRTLIQGLDLGYKELGEDLTATRGTGNVTLGDLPLVASDSSTGREILRCAKAIHDAATNLKNAWDTWKFSDATHPATFTPTHFLDAEIDKVVAYINSENIQKVTAQGTKLVMGAGFSIYYEPFGDLTHQEAWQKLAQQAYRSWVANLLALDTAATLQASALNNAFADLEYATSSFTFNPGFTDLGSKYAENTAKNKQKELEEKGGGAGGDKAPPKIDPNAIGGGGGLGDKKGNVPPPDLKKPPPTLGLNPPGLGPGGSVRNPDGSVTVRNPDGSYTTTYPDGRQEKTPAGSPPPFLGLNPPPGSGTGPKGGIPLKTVKGPDGSTTSYNQDGSRTVTHKDGTTTTIGRDGTATTVNPDGSTTVLHKDGSETISYPDGTKTTIRPDGSAVTQFKDGSTQIRATDGTLTTTDPEGNKTVTRPEAGQTVHNPDRSTTTFNKDGSATTVHTNGTRTTVSPNGTVTTVDPDGTKTVSHLGKNTSTIEYADGAVAKVDKDGTVVTTYKDGTSTKLGPDGTYTTTEPDGDKKTEHLNPLGGNAGAETKHNPDGSTTTKYPDGTVDQKFQDGGHKVTYPDGRTVTTDASGRTVSVTGGPTGAGPNLSSGRLSDYDYYDYPDDYRKSAAALSGGGYGSGGGPSAPPPLGANPLGHSLTAPPGTNTGPTVPGERTRGTVLNESAATRGRIAQLAAEEAAALRRPATTSGGMPMMPPMGGMGGGGQSTQSEERERATWVSEDEDVWGTDEGGVSAVIGR